VVVPASREPGLLDDFLSALPDDPGFSILLIVPEEGAPPAAASGGGAVLGLPAGPALERLLAGLHDLPSGHPADAAEVLRALLRTRGEEAAAVVVGAADPESRTVLAEIRRIGGIGMEITQRPPLFDGDLPAVANPTEVAERVAGFFDRRMGSGEAPPPALKTILRSVGRRTGNDFSGYKPSTLLRRVRRRMDALGLSRLSDYASVVEEDPGEADLLLDSLLIKVTAFFRDAAAFEALGRRGVPDLLAQARRSGELRVWVPGCATGEEVYSLAFLLDEALEDVPVEERPRLKIFASDIDESAIRAARAAVFSAEAMSGLSPERIARFFQPAGGGFKVAKPIRDSIVFAQHNLISDPPFSRLDLVSCRNLLIYLDQPQQDRLVALFHYALRPGGVLMLGSAESILHTSSLFEPIDSVRRLFRRRDAPAGLPPSALSGPDRKIFSLPPWTRSGRAVGAVASAQAVLLDDYAPAHLVVGARRELLHTSPRIGRYLEVAAGPPTTDLLKLARPSLRPALEALMQSAAESGRRTVRRDVALREETAAGTVDLVAVPLGAGNMLIVFQDVSALRHPTDHHEEVEASDREGDRQRAEEMEAELRAVYDRLSRTVEDLGAANEELQSSNEEMTSVNHELQTSNQQLEEAQTDLEAAKQQLELLNADLQEKVVALEAAGSDLQNFFDSAEIAILFFDARLILRRHTAAAEVLLQISERDAGRSLREGAAEHGLGPLDAAAARVLRSLQIEESEVVLDQGEVVLHLRLLPYRTLEGLVSGVVLTIVDLSRTRVAEARARQLDRALQARIVEVEALLDLMPVGVAIASGAEFTDVRLNRRGRELLADVPPTGPERTYVLAGALQVERDGEPLERKDWPLERAVLTGLPVGQEAIVIRRAASTPIELSVSAVPLFGPDGRVSGGIAAFEDVSRGRERERRLERLARQHHAVAALGAKALAGKGLADLMHEAVVRLRDALGVDYAKVLELLPDRQALIMRAGVGWREGLVGVATVENDRRSQAGFTLETDAAVVVEDFARESRFLPPDLLTSHGVRSGMSTIIAAGDHAYGVLGIHHREPRAYTEDQVDFLRAVANILAAAVLRTEDRQALSDSEARSRRLIETASDAILVVGLSNGGPQAIVGANPAAGALLGYDLDRLLSVAPGEIADWPLELRGQIEGGDPVRRETIYRAASGEEIPVEESLALLSREGGGTLVAIARDIRERRRAERRRRLLMHELQHRIKNPLATIRSLVYLSGRGKTSVADFVQSFDGRLQAMTRGQNLVLLSERPTVSLDHIVREELAPFLAADQPPVDIEGEALQVPTRLGLPLSMALHELTSNAARHGALSRPEGRVRVSWTLSGDARDRTLLFRWDEKGGPPVRPPSSSGFGRTLLERGLAYELRGEASLQFEEEGVRYWLSVPLDELERMLDQQMLDLEDDKRREEPEQ